MQERPYVGFYVQDVEFRSIVVTVQTPLRMCLSASLSGFLPPDPCRAFRYCDLCCGDGTTIIALAILNPESEFWGIDFNPQHIKKGQERIERYGLKNVRLIQADLAEIDFKDFPEFDFITINGAYSWLEEPLRQKILDFVGEKLKEGGLFYVQYMALPGRISIEPLWKLIQRLVPPEKYSSGRERAKKGLYFLRLLAKRGMFYLQANPPAARATQFYLTTTKNDEYFIDHFAHNALASGFRPFYFYEIYSEIKKRGLEFAGSVDPALNDLELAVPPTQVPTFFEITDIELVETVKDFIRNTMDRRDLFIKGGVKDFSRAYEFLKERIKIFPALPVTEINRVLPVIGGARIPLKGPVYDKVFKLFEEGRSFITLEDLGEFQEKQVLKALTRLLATQEFEVALKEPYPEVSFKEDEEVKFELYPEINEEFLEEAREEFFSCVLVSEITRGAGSPLSPLEVLFLSELKENGRVDFERLKEKLSSVTKVVQTLQGQKPANALSTEELERMFKAFSKRKIPLLMKLGILKVL